MTNACPSLAVCTVLVRRHGSVSARRAGWAACATKVSLINLAGHFLLYFSMCLLTFPDKPEGWGESQNLGGTQVGVWRISLNDSVQLENI